MWLVIEILQATSVGGMLHDLFRRGTHHAILMHAGCKATPFLAGLPTQVLPVVRRVLSGQPF
jgi:hypothetical protein